MEDAFYSLLGKVTKNFVASFNTDNNTTREQLVKKLHDTGINLRLMGFVRSHFSKERKNIRTFLLVEMITRVTKNYLRTRMRNHRPNSGVPVEAIVVEHFNLLLGESPASTFFWHTSIKVQICCKFGKYGQALTSASFFFSLVLILEFHMCPSPLIYYRRRNGYSI